MRASSVYLVIGRGSVPNFEILYVSLLGAFCFTDTRQPYELCIERIWATNNASEADSVAHEPALKEGEGGKLLTKQGQKITWGKQ